MDLRKHCGLMHRYQRWAFATLFAHLDLLDDEAYGRDVGLFFKSIHGTLNHLLLVDHVWFGRLTHDPFPVKTLADTVEPDRARIKSRLLARGEAWAAYLDGLDDAGLAGVASFHKIDGTPATLPRASAILHVVNHGTHHRGQITAAVTQLGGKAPEIDLPYFLYTLPAAEIS